ncbi:MAG: protein of unknown function DUF3310 [Caudoviricetes sp.]|nr:MAG: protein of unknown function DUF3310 [Caudoviricetes sp.]
MEKNERVYTEATDRLKELHKNYTGNKSGNPTNAVYFDNCDNNNDTGCFYAEYGRSTTAGYKREGYKHLTEQEFIEFMGFDLEHDTHNNKRVVSIEKAKETLDSLIENGLKSKPGYGEDLNIAISMDNVNNPSHYTQGSIEPIDYITANNLNFLEGNVVKYVTRYKHKNGLEDLKKAEFYLKRLIKEYDTESN